MATTLSNLTVNISANTTNFSSAMKGLTNALGNIQFGMANLGTSGTVGMDALQQGTIGVGNAMWKIAGVAALVGTVAAVGIGVKAVKAAGDYQSALTSLVTGAGEAQSNLKMVGDGILKISTDTGTSTQQLTDAMYQIESSGLHGAAGLSTLRAAAEGARVGNADLGTTAGALSTILTDYHMSANQASSAMSGLVATTAAGRMHLQDLAGSMGSVLPLASSLGIAFPQVGGAIATMTNAGMDAQRASMNLANAIRALAAPSGTATKSMKQVGLSAQQLKDTLSSQGITGAIQLVEQHVGKTFPAGSVAAVQAFKNIMGGATGYNVALMLGGKNMQTFTSNVASISKAMQSGKGDVMGWAQVQQDFNFKMQQAQQAVNVLMIKIGQALLPAVTQLMSQITPLVVKFADWLVSSGALQNSINFLVGAIKFLVTMVSSVVSFFEHNRVAMIALEAVAITLAGAILASMVVAFYAWAVAAGTAAISTLALTWPILLIGAVIALVVAGIILAIQNWGAISKWLQGVWSGISKFFANLWKDIQGIFSGIGKWFTDRFNEAAQGVQSGVKKAQSFFGGIGAWFQNQGKTAAKGAQDGWKNITDAFQQGAKNSVAAFQWLYNHNYYVKDATDAIIKWTQDFNAWWNTTWTNLVQFVAQKWNDIKSAFNSAVTWLRNLVTSWWNSEILGWTNGVNLIKSLALLLWIDVKNEFLSALAFLTGIALSLWTMEVDGWTRIWNSVKSIASSLWADVAGIFNSAWSLVSGPLGGLWSNITGWFNNLVGQAESWGSNLIQGFINGINNMIGGVGQAASNIAGQVASFLGFHSPAKEGPGSELMIWGPNMVKGFSQGIIAGIPTLRAAMQQLSTNLVPSAGGMSLASGGVSSYAMPSGNGAALMLAAQSSSSAAGDAPVIHNHIYLDGQEMTAVIGNRMMRTTRTVGGTRR